MFITHTQKNLVYVLFITTLCVFGYKGFVTHPWSYDDLDHIKHAQIAHTKFSHLLSPEAKEPSRIVLNLYFYTAYSLFGENPAYYHTAKIIFHIANSILLAYVFLTFFKNRYIAGLSGFLFAINGTHYEAVYHIAGTGYLLCTFFALLTILNVYRSAHNTGAIFFAVASYAATVFSYEGGLIVIIPALYIWWTFQNKEKKLPIALLSIVGVFFILEKWVLGYMHTKATFYDLGIGWHIPHTFFLFLGRAFLNILITPFGWTSLPPKDIPRDDLTFYVIAGILIFLVLIYFSTKSRPIRLLTIWLCATILPTTLGTHAYYYTRYFYLPAIGASGILAYGLCQTRHRFTPRIWTIAHIPLIILLTYLGLHKLYMFEGYFLFNTANYYASPNYANKPKMAIDLYERTLTQYTIQDPVLVLNLATCYEQTGQTEKASEQYQEAIALSPNDARAYHALARLSLQNGLIDQAVTYAQQATQMDSQFINEYQKLGAILYNSGYVEQAERVLQNALQIAPNHPSNDLVYYNLGVLYQNQGNIQSALDAYEKASAQQTQITEVYQNLSGLYRQTGQTEAAQKTAQKAKRALSTP